MEKLPIEEIYEFEKNKTHTIRSFGSQENLFVKFKVCGYVKNSKYLIGILDSNCGIKSIEDRVDSEWT